MAQIKIKSSWAGTILFEGDFPSLAACLQAAVVAGADLSGANLRSADLRSANLRSADLSGANLRSADLRSADLRSADLRSADLRSANLSGANLSGADLSGANLSGANLRSADLSGANLRSADLRSADLSGANLSGANLSGANLSGANLRSADLSGANLSGTDLKNKSAAEWLTSNFECDAEGVIVYKAFKANGHGPHYSTPDRWKLEAGAMLTEVPNWLRSDTCGCGVNFGTLTYVQTEHEGLTIWRCRIRWIDLADVVVPIDTDGKARCARLELIEVVK